MDEFEAHRPHLHAVATRILGSRAEADDALQEAWLRSRAPTRRRRQHRRLADDGRLARVPDDARLAQAPPRGGAGERRLPDPVIAHPDETAPDPEGEALAADAVGAALLVVLESLQPAERLAFVLHDVFAVPFEDIATIVDRSPAAARQLASRARRRVQGADPDAPTADREIVDAFVAAGRDGDFAALLELLDPDVVLRADDGTGALRIIHGAREVATNARAFGTTRVAHPAVVDGAAGFVATEDGSRSPCSRSRSATAGSRRSTHSEAPTASPGSGSTRSSRASVPAVQFSRELRDDVLAGDIALGIRLWKRPQVKEGGRYRVGPGLIEIDAVELVPFSAITEADVRQAGEPDRETLRERAAHAGPIDEDTLVYRIELHAVSP